MCMNLLPRRWSYVLFDSVFWLVVMPLFMCSYTSIRAGTDLTTAYFISTQAILSWHLYALVRRYIYRDYTFIPLSLALESASVVMGGIIVAYASAGVQQAKYMVAVPLGLVGIAIILAHGMRIGDQDVSCYYWCG